MANTDSKQPEYTNVDEYIALFPQETQEILRKVRGVIQENAPDATEKISWQMPTYHQKTNLVHFAAAKNHLGIYPGPEAIEFFEPRLGEYKHSKGAIQFPFKKPIPYDFIAEIVRFRVNMVEG